MSIIDKEAFRKRFFELDIDFKPSQIDAIFCCLGDSEIADDVVVPIRCKNCRYAQLIEEENDWWECGQDGRVMHSDGFCSWAKGRGVLNYKEMKKVIDKHVANKNVSPTVIRCKDCKYYDVGENEEECWTWCRVHDSCVAEEFYCSWAEKNDTAKVIKDTDNGIGTTRYSSPEDMWKDLATISSGLPLKGERKVVNEVAMKLAERKEE